MADATAAPPPPPPLPDEAPPKVDVPAPTAAAEAAAAKIEESSAAGADSGNGEVVAPPPGEESAAPVDPAPEEAALAADDSLPSFKEESYFEKDLKESEKKALHELSDKVEAAIKAREFVLPPRVEVVKETVEMAKVDEALLVATTIEKEVKDGDLEVKVEEASLVVVAPEEAAPEEDKDKDSSLVAGEGEAAGSEEAKATPEEKKNSEKVEEASSRMEEAPATPAKVEDATPAKVEDAASAKVEDATPAKGADATPAKVEDAAPAKAEEESPAKVEEPKIEEAPAPAPGSAIEAGQEGVIVPPPIVTESRHVEEDTAPPEDLELWGVPLLASKGDPRTQVIFLKFLRARDFKVKDAFTMLKNCILWRKRYGADKILEEDLGTEFEASAFNHGVDKEGHPVQYNDFGVFQDEEFYQKVFGDAAKTEKALRWRVQLLEKQIQTLNFNPGGVTSMLQVVDMKNAPLLGKKGVRIFMSQALKLLTDNYPELVVKIVLLNTPWYFSTIFAFISPFFTQRTKSKFIFGSSLFKFIAPDNIPVQYGGLSRANDTEFGDASASVTELVLKAGEKKSASIEVSGAGDTVVWEFALVGSDVTYGAEFVPSKEGAYTTIVEKPKKITSLEEPIRNTFKSPEPGNLVLSVDNSVSRKKKTALYRYIIKTPSSGAKEE